MRREALAVVGRSEVLDKHQCFVVDFVRPTTWLVAIDQEGRAFRVHAEAGGARVEGGFVSSTQGSVAGLEYGSLAMARRCAERLCETIAGTLWPGDRWGVAVHLADGRAVDAVPNWWRDALASEAA